MAHNEAPMVITGRLHRMNRRLATMMIPILLISWGIVYHTIGIFFQQFMTAGIIKIKKTAALTQRSQRLGLHRNGIKFSGICQCNKCIIVSVSFGLILSVIKIGGAVKYHFFLCQLIQLDLCFMVSGIHQHETIADALVLAGCMLNDDNKRIMLMAGHSSG